MKWDRRPPTNGRTVNSADVKFSWDKFVELGNSGGELAQARNEDAAVVSMTTPDDMTVVFNLAYPYGGILDIFANQQTFYVMPADESSGFNYAADMRGTGPYELEKFVPSASATYKRRDDWYGSPEPYFDRLERTTREEDAQPAPERLAVEAAQGPQPPLRRRVGRLLVRERRHRRLRGLAVDALARQLEGQGAA